MVDTTACIWGILVSNFFPKTCYSVKGFSSFSLAPLGKCTAVPQSSSRPLLFTPVSTHHAYHTLIYNV